MPDAHLKQHPKHEKPKLHPQDYFIKYTFNYFVPKSITPNHITAMRFLLTPAVIGLLYMENYFWGMLLFIITAFTDMLDGGLARIRDQITDWGKVYDPLADKFLIVSSILVMAIKYIDIYLTMAVVLMEVLFILMAGIGKAKGREVQANVWGKIKMCLQVTAVFLICLGLILNIPQLFVAASAVFGAAVLFAILSLLSFGI